MNVWTLRRISILGLTITLVGIHPAAQGADSSIGTWVLNIPKSTFNPGPPPQSESRTYVMVHQETKLTSTGVDGDGKPTTREWTIGYDGKDRPMTGDPDADMVSLKRLDAFTTEFSQKNAGKVVITGTQAISKDGTVMTITTSGINAKGQTINNVLVFDKR